MQLFGKRLHRPGDLRQLSRAVITLLKRGHQLQVIDDDQTQTTALTMQASAAGPEVCRIEARRLVNINRRFVQLTQCISEALPLFVVELARTNLVLIDPTNR